MADKHHKIIEGAAAVALSGFRDHITAYKKQRVVIIIWRSNIATGTLKDILQ